MYERRWNYICDCGGTKYYFPEVDDSPTYTALGYEPDEEWICDNESLDVDLVTDRCYKGEGVFDYDPTFDWCDGIPLQIHAYDIIEWPNRGIGRPLVDLLNGICKQSDFSWSLLNSYDGT